MRLSILAIISLMVGSSAESGPPVKPLILGGQPTNTAATPFIATLQSRREITRHMCGSVIISSRVLLTAAHCVNKSSVRELVVAVGISNLHDAGEKGHQHNIVRIIPHEHYNPKTLENDIAILLLQDKITFSSNVKPIALDKCPSVARKGVTVVSSGWGMTYNHHQDKNHLRSVKLKIADEQECQRLVKKKHIICTGVKGESRGAAPGDSGGPLVAENRLVGITSFMVLNTQQHHSGVNGYTRVASFHSWIHRHAGCHLRNH